MARKAKIVKRVVKRRVKKNVEVAPNPIFSTLEALANKPQPKHEEQGDSRSSVLEALAQVLITQNDAIQTIANIANSAPNYNNLLIRG